MKRIKRFVKNNLLKCIIVSVFVLTALVMLWSMNKAYDNMINTYCRMDLEALADYVYYRKSVDENSSMKEIMDDYSAIFQKSTVLIFEKIIDDKEHQFTANGDDFALVFTSNQSFASGYMTLQTFMDNHGIGSGSSAALIYRYYVSPRFNNGNVAYYAAMFRYTNGEKYVFVNIFPAEKISMIIAKSSSGLLIITSMALVMLIAIICMDTRMIFSYEKKLLAKEDLIKQQDVRYELLSDLTNEFMFEYNVKADNLTFSKKYQDVFQRGRIFVPFRNSLPTRYTIFHEDIPNLMKEIDRVFREKCIKGEYMFRLQMIDGSYEWFNLVYQISYDPKSGDASTVVGKLVNVHRAKVEKDILISKSSTDPLTKLSNRETAHKAITNFLEADALAGSKGAIMIMDIDHFKSINDTFGHSKGDELLIEAAQWIKTSFRSNDVVSRLGGDEFMIFMKNFMQESDAIRKCTELNDTFRRTITYDNASVDISTSIGLYFINPGDTYEEVYARADSALYNAKEGGRDRFCIYSSAAHVGNTFNKKR